MVEVRESGSRYLRFYAFSVDNSTSSLRGAVRLLSSLQCPGFFFEEISRLFIWTFWLEQHTLRNLHKGTKPYRELWRHCLEVSMMHENLLG